MLAITKPDLETCLHRPHTISRYAILWTCDSNILHHDVPIPSKQPTTRTLQNRKPKNPEPKPKNLSPKP